MRSIEHVSIENHGKQQKQEEEKGGGGGGCGGGGERGRKKRGKTVGRAKQPYVR
jgi:hypothetical protein